MRQLKGSRKTAIWSYLIMKNCENYTKQNARNIIVLPNFPYEAVPEEIQSKSMVQLSQEILLFS